MAINPAKDRRAAAGGFPVHAVQALVDECRFRASHLPVGNVKACVLWRTAATQYWLQCEPCSVGRGAS